MENEQAILKGFKSENNAVISSVPFLIGRSRTANFIIAHVNVSRNHCQIVKENASWKVCDFSSSGTYVNGTLVGKEHSTILNDGDCIRFGPAESNLCWTFYAFDSSSETAADLQKEPQAVFCDPNLKDNHCSNKVIYLSNELVDSSNERQEVLKTLELHLSKRPNEIKLDESKIKNDIEDNEISEKLKNFKEDIFITKEVNLKGENESKKILELTKELQEIQNALNDLEKKNSALQGKLSDEGKVNITVTSNLVENLTDLMETELQCTICSELFLTAVTLNCTHTFCKYCIDQWKKKQKTCPICRKKIINETRSLVVDNYIDKMVENLSSELKSRRETIIKERINIEPVKKRSKVKR